MEEFRSGVLFNACYGGFGFSSACKEEYKKRTGKDLVIDYRSNIRSDACMIELFHEFGSKWMSGRHSAIYFEPIIPEFLNYIKIKEYDGVENICIDYDTIELKYYKAFTKKVQENSGTLKEEYDELERKLGEFEELKKKQDEYDCKWSNWEKEHNLDSDAV